VDLLGRELLRERGEIADVGEEHGHDTAARREASLVALPHQRADDLLGEEEGHPPPLPLRADEVLGRGRAVAEHQADRERRPTPPLNTVGKTSCSAWVVEPIRTILPVSSPGNSSGVTSPLTIR